MTALFIFICAFFGIILAKIAVNMRFLPLYILLTFVGLSLFLCGTYIFSIASIQAAIGSIAFTLVFMVTLIGHKKNKTNK